METSEALSNALQFYIPVHVVVIIYSRISISRTRIYRTLQSSKRLSESRYILIAFSNNNLALGTFLQVQITRSARVI